MTKSLKCREHNGNFMVEARRGRPPVKCNPDNPCDGVTAKRKLAKATGLREEQIVIAPSRVERTASAIKNRRANGSRINSEPPSQANPGLTAAKAAKADLEEMGWSAQGKESGDLIEVTASRGAESLVTTFSADGQLIRQDYSMWHSKPSRNAMPTRKLKFNPDEMTDNELIRAISGMKVTYWNSLGKSEESYVVSGDKLSIEHFYSSNGDEDSARRMVKFIDLNGNGFRHFHVDALLKVG